MAAGVTPEKRRRKPVHRSYDPRRTPDPAMLREAVEAHNAGDFVKAGELYAELERRYPPHHHARMMGAVLYYQRTSDPEPALDLLPQVILALPKWPDPRYNLGVILEGLGRFDEARARFEQVVDMDPNHHQAWVNLGNVRLTLGDVPGALAAFAEALDIAPDDPLGQYNLAHPLGLIGQWDACYRLYEYRWLMPGHLRDHGLPRLVPQWDGTPTGHLIITDEQGAGDVLQFVRFLPRIAARCRQLTVRVRHAGLLPLLRASFPDVTITGLDAEIPDADAHLPLLSCVSRLGLGPDQVWRGPYLAAPRAPRLSGQLTLGLCWAGAASHKRDGTRSIPFDAVRPLLDLPGVQWVNLTFNERGDVDDPRLLSVRDRCPDYLASASLYQALDGVVTVDSSPLHLAGALGIPTLGLIAAAPDFRWMLQRVDTPWYPDVTLVRQRQGGDWSDVIDRVRQVIEAEAWPPRLEDA